MKRRGKKTQTIRWLTSWPLPQYRRSWIGFHISERTWATTGKKIRFGKKLIKSGNSIGIRIRFHSVISTVTKSVISRDTKSGEMTLFVKYGLDPRPNISLQCKCWNCGEIGWHHQDKFCENRRKAPFNAWADAGTLPNLLTYKPWLLSM